MQTVKKYLDIKNLPAYLWYVNRQAGKKLNGNTISFEFCTMERCFSFLSQGLSLCR